MTKAMGDKGVEEKRPQKIESRGVMMERDRGKEGLLRQVNEDP
jgi:hypothetical protein